MALKLEPENISVNGVAPNLVREWFRLKTFGGQDIRTKSITTGSNFAPQFVFDMFEAQGLLTPRENVTTAFLSFLGDNKETGKSINIHFLDHLANIHCRPYQRSIFERRISPTSSRAYKPSCDSRYGDRQQSSPGASRSNGERRGTGKRLRERFLRAAA